MITQIYEEDIEMIHMALVAVLGRDGRMLPRGKNVLMNATVFSPQTGMVWYGDMYKEEVEVISGMMAHFNLAEYDIG